MRLRFTPKAIENIAAIADYIHARNPSAVLGVRDDIYNGLQNLLLFPKAGRRQETASVRKLVTRKFAYLIYYTLEDTADELIVISVKHPAERREYADD